MPSKVLAFVGDDPGQKGAGCLLGVLDDPDGARHGEVVYVAVWDHALRKTERGEHVDPCHFAAMVREHAALACVDGAVRALERDMRVDIASVVIEVPNVQGKFGKFNAGSIITQGANYGIVLAASLCSSEFRAEVVEGADASAGRWRTEAGLPVPKGADPKAHSITCANILLNAWSKAGARIVGPMEKLTHDQADAVLLAHLGVLRWLGRTVAPADAGAAARGKARAKAVRDHEIARAVEGVNAKALKATTLSISCPKCKAVVGERCGRAMCRERGWAAASSLKSPRLGFSVLPPAMTAGAVITCSRGVWRTGTEKVDRATLDAAIDSGLVRLTLDDKRRPVWVVR